MKKLLVLVSLLCILTSLSFADTPMYGFDLSINGKYVWRGIPYNSETVLWPDAWISWRGFTGTVWGSVDVTDVKDEQWELTDISLFIDYASSFDGINYSIGYGHYTYPGYADFFETTGEIYGKIGTDLGPLQVSLAAYFDIIEINGIYITPELSKSVSSGNLTTTFSVSVGYANGKHNEYYFFLDKSGLTDLTAGIALSYSPVSSLGNYMAFNGNINYATILDSELAETYEDDSNFWWGIGISIFLGGE